MDNSNETTPPSRFTAKEHLALDRRRFLRTAGLGGAALAIPGLLAACARDVTAPVTTGVAGQDKRVGDAATVTLDFAQDIGVLNYAYALEQLEAAFYVQVLASPYAGMNAAEARLLSDIRDHEVAHRDFFAAALGGARIPDLTVDFSSIDFTNRRQVLRSARIFEDLGVTAYNGAARYLKSERYLIVAGKIVSVEARHAAAIRDLQEPRSAFFAPAAFDGANRPDVVLAAAGTFVVDSITAINI